MSDCGGVDDDDDGDSFSASVMMMIPMFLHDFRLALQENLSFGIFVGST